MSTESKGKHRVKDMSFKPEDVKTKSNEPEVSGNSDKKAVVVTRRERKDPSRRISHHRGHGRQKSTVCVKKGDDCQRVPRSEAEKLVTTGWAYCSRSAWRTARSGVTPVAPVAKKSKKLKVTEETSEA